MPSQLIVILIVVPIVLLSVTLKKRHFIQLYYGLRPRGTILKTKVALLTVGDSINHRVYINGKRNGDSRKVTINAISEDTITIKFFDEYPKKYIRLLPNGELVLMAFGD